MVQTVLSSTKCRGSAKPSQTHLDRPPGARPDSGAFPDTPRDRRFEQLVRVYNLIYEPDFEQLLLVPSFSHQRFAEVGWMGDLRPEERGKRVGDGGAKGKLGVSQDTGRVGDRSTVPRSCT